MNEADSRPWEVTVYCTVTAPSYDEALAAVQRSGIVIGRLIGEVRIDQYDVEGE